VGRGRDRRRRGVRACDWRGDGDRGRDQSQRRTPCAPPLAASATDTSADVLANVNADHDRVELDSKPHTERLCKSRRVVDSVADCEFLADRDAIADCDTDRDAYDNR
jgi:hypothetical protein